MTRKDYLGAPPGGFPATPHVAMAMGCHDGSMTSLPAEVEGHDKEPTELVQARPEALALVRPSPPAVVRTFAEGEDTVRTWSRLRRFEYRVPAGSVHAAELGGDATLCGRPLSSLLEFGRSRYPFERIDQDDRCRVCDEAAGQPQA